jgi:hypothetical protein
MAKLRIDKILDGNVVMHEHGIEDLNSTVTDKYVEVAGDTMTGALKVDIATATDAVIVEEASGNKKFSVQHGTNTVKQDFYSPEPDNKITNGGFETDLTGWTVVENPTEYTDANGSVWVLIPKLAGFTTHDFYVMKYQAKAWDTQTDSVITDGGFSSANGWAGVNSQTRYQARSVVAGRPWVKIAQNHDTNFDAKEACSALGSSYHLINNNEWMSITRNAQDIDSNWTLGTVGSGALFRGNSDSGASLDNTNPLTGINTRTLTLSNGAVIWDMAGNVWQWTDNLQTSAINTTAEWVEWNSGNIASGAIDLYGPADGYLSAQGMGQVYGGTLNNAFLRGGYWSNASYAGVFTLYLFYAPGLQSYTVGFRCASDSVDILQSFSSSIKYAGNQSLKLEVGSGNVGGAPLLQSVTLTDTLTYTLIAYAYTDGVSEIDEDDLELYYDDDVLTTSYTSMGSGWYRLTGTLTGVASAKNYGVRVHAGKTVYLDTVSLQAGSGATIEVTFENSSSGVANATFENDLTAGGNIIGTIDDNI